MSKNYQRKFFIASVAIVLSPVLIGVLFWAAFWLIFRPSLPPQENTIYIPRPEYMLHLQRRSHTVIVPFDLEGRAIFLTVRVGNKIVDAQLDTGSAAILWPSDLHLGPIQDTVKNNFRDVGGQGVHADLSILTDMHIGGLELKNIPSYALNYPKELKVLALRQRHILLLGDATFAGCILTIDYAKKELILHPASYQPPKTAKCYPCFWTNADSLTYAGNPTVLGSLEGKKARVVLDTGWSHDTIGLSRSLYRQIQPKLVKDTAATETEVYQGIFGQTSDTLIPNCHFSVLGTAGTATAEVVPMLPQGEEMILYANDLPGSRITIDYPGKRVWLEPESSPSPHRQH